jgi:hypothetical protein
LHALLYIFDGLPFWHLAFGIVCHVVYLQHFSKSWPFISLASPTFILSCVLVVVDHFIWFFHFAGVAQEAKRTRAAKYRYSAQPMAKDPPSFLDVATFFAICVWFIPLFLFLSLSANDNVIPSFGKRECEMLLTADSSAPSTPLGGTIDLSGSPQPRSGGSSSSLVKSVLSPILALIPRIGRRGRSDEGLIAPRTPGHMSPARSTDGYTFWGGDAQPNGNVSPPPQMYATSALNTLDSRLQSVAANRSTPPPPHSRTSMSSDHGSGEVPTMSSLSRPAAAVRNRSESKKAD